MERRLPRDTIATKVNVLEPPGRFSALHLGELWHYRELLYILAWRDVKVRYKQAVLGAAWAVLQPLVLMGIFTLLFSRIADVPTGDVPYPVFAFVGLVPWTMFASATTSSGASLVGNQNLVSKVYFPRLVIPAGAVLTWVPDFVISSALLFGVMAVFGFAPPLTALLLPVVMLAVMLAAFSVGVWLSALNVAYRDVQYVVPFLIQAWLFMTPVAYPTSSVPEGLRWLTGLNPMTWVIDLSRWALTGSSVSWSVASISLATTLVLLVSGLYYFRRVEHFFADVI
ncbi:MAG: ABC transporter permease [Actinomycetota bacterium]|nr:ABC transporter permease [Actinomycetota bacterium]